MKSFSEFLKGEHRFEHSSDLQETFIKLYSKPKIFIPTKLVNGKRKPTIEKGKRWYVYFYYRDRESGLLNRKVSIYRNINSYTSIKKRKKAAEYWIRFVTYALKKGWNPYDEESKYLVKADKSMTIKAAFNHALEHKKGSLKLGSYKAYYNYVILFLAWCKTMEMEELDILELEQTHIIDYLNYLRRDPPSGRGLKPTSVANSKRHLSAIMAKLYEDKIIPKNFILDIKTKKGKPEKNQPFTKAEIVKIKAYCLEHEPVLYDFLRFIFYSFLRNQEIVRIQVKHIDMEKRLISIPTKADKMSHILMIEPMYQFLLSKKLRKCKKGDFLFTHSGKPGPWDSSEKGRVAYFSKRFLTVKDHFGFDANKTTYSFRHNAAVDLFQSFVDSGLSEQAAIGKLMNITRHKSESALRNYLREVGGILPEDWSDSYNMKF